MLHVVSFHYLNWALYTDSFTLNIKKRKRIPATKDRQSGQILEIWYEGNVLNDKGFFHVFLRVIKSIVQKVNNKNNLLILKSESQKAASLTVCLRTARMTSNLKSVSSTKVLKIVSLCILLKVPTNSTFLKTAKTISQVACQQKTKNKKYA